MTAISNLAKLTQTGTALATAGEGIKLATKKKKKVGDFIDTGATTIVGSSFLRAQGKLISNL